jgi:lysozyme
MAGGKSRLWRYAELALVLLLGAFMLWDSLLGWAPSREQYPVQGIVVDAAHGKLDWPMLAATGVDFAYMVATEGAMQRDARFAANIAGAREAGVRYGPLHRYDLCDLASDQATRFITTVPRSDTALPAAVEFGFSEDCASKPDRALILSEVATFLSQIEAHLGKPAVLKISQDFEEHYRLSSSIDRTVWLEKTWLLPEYAARPWVMWTANPQRRIDGVEEPVQWVVVRE